MNQKMDTIYSFSSQETHFGRDSKVRLVKLFIGLFDGLCRVCNVLLTNPLASLIILLLIPAVSVGSGWYAMFKVQPSPVIDLSINAFSVPNHVISQRQDALDVALQDYTNFMKTGYRSRRSAVEDQLSSVDEGTLSLDLNLEQAAGNVQRKKRSSSNGEPQRTQYQRTHVVHLVYLAVNGENIFTLDRLASIREFEKDLLDLQSFSEFCYVENFKCAPLISLVEYIHSLMLDESQQSLDEAVRQALSSSSGLYFTDGHATQNNLKSRFLRAEISFGFPLPGFLSPVDRVDEQKAKLNGFLEVLMDFCSHSSMRDVRVLYGGGSVFDLQVRKTFWNDLKMAVFAFAAIIILVFVLTSFSIWLTIWSVITVALSFPLAFFFYRVVFKVVNLGILNGVAAFVIVGIGVDDVFVFINTFRQAHAISSISGRLAFTVKEAGKATFFTSFTTAAAFAANVFSSIPAVHDFGLFMALIVTCCWILVVLLMPAAINIWFRWFMHCETACFKCCTSKCKANVIKPLPDDVASFFKSPVSIQHQVLDDDSDVLMLLLPEEHDSALITGATNASTSSAVDTYDDALLPLDEEGIAQNFGRDLRLQCNTADDPLLILEEELLQESAERQTTISKEGCSLTIALQSFVHFYIAVPVVKARLVIIVMFFVLLVISVGFMSQLRPATKPPQLYRPNSNLQMLLDLMVNYTDEGVPWQATSYISEFKASMAHSTVGQTGRPSSKVTVHQDVIGLFTASGVTTRSMVVPTSTRPAPLPTTPYPTTLPTVLPSVHVEPLPRSTTSLSTSRLPPATTTTSVQQTTTTTPSRYVPQTKIPASSDHPQISLEKGITVQVVFGLDGIDRSNVTGNHVLSEKGTVIYSNAFSKSFDVLNLNVSLIVDLCRLCTRIGNNSELVKANTARCLPSHPAVDQLISGIAECRNLPRSSYVDGKPQVALYGNHLKWITFSFESTTFKGVSSFAAYKQYQQWQQFMDNLRSSLPPDSPLRDFYQTADFWKQMVMEIVAVSSAVYGLVLSLVICVVAVAIFTGHLGLLAITILTLLGMVCFVVSVFYWAGWELGAIEAISLSILVGSSVDYCVHIVEGYILAGKNLPGPGTGQDKCEQRKWRARVAVSHIGVSVVSSGLTTLAAALPLTQAMLLPFARFGQIVAINAAVSMVFAMVACVAFLATWAPSSFKSNFRSRVVTVGSTVFVVGAAVAVLFAVSRINGIHIPGPSGNDLFS